MGPMKWVGPLESEIDDLGRLRVPVPPERWSYGPPLAHEAACSLHRRVLWCDCAASAASDYGYGERA